MQYRRFQAPGGQFLAALFTTSGEFAAPAEDVITDLEAGYGVSGLVTVDADGDPWDGESALIESAPPPPPPDANGFLMAAMAALGLARGNALLAAWPTFTVALGAANWTVARTVIDAATQAGSVNGDERATLLALLTEHGIPE